MRGPFLNRSLKNARSSPRIFLESDMQLYLSEGSGFGRFYFERLPKSRDIEVPVTDTTIVQLGKSRDKASVKSINE